MAATGQALLAERALLSGWGRTAPTVARVVRVRSEDDVAAALAGPPRGGTLARGLGRSYGDAAQNGDGEVLDVTGLDRVHGLDLEEGVATVGAGRSIGELLRVLVPLGWFVPVSPGTRHVTIGGALAADVHGKNHHVAGSFGQHVLSYELCVPGGSILKVSPAGTPDVFWAGVGGMGLTGVVTRATLRLLPIDSAWMRVDTVRARDLDDCMATMAACDAEYRYSVAWVDCLAKGADLGRSVIDLGEHAIVDELPHRLFRTAHAYSPRTLGTVPRWMPNGLVNRVSSAMFNELWFRRARESVTYKTISSYFHPLDAVSCWNRAYGPSGLLQYQFVVPFGGEDVIRTAIEGVSTRRLPCFLTVLKRLGQESDGYLSFPKPGWTLAMDFPANAPGLVPFLASLDEAVAAAGGRIYLAKDARMDSHLIPTMYPRLQEWRAVRDRLDPDRCLTSTLAQRLDLVG